MDPRTGDYALVNGRDYRLDAARRGVGPRALPAELSSARPPCSDQRVDGVALLAVDVCEARVVGLLDLEPR